MLNEFHTGGKLTSINYSWIVLIQKMDGASDIGDFRPICPVNCAHKIVSKVLANHLKEAVGAR